MFFPQETFDCLLTFFPPLIPNSTIILSTRRNKGTLFTDKKKYVWRCVNLSFLNSGTNDGYSSSILRECAILRGPLANHPNIVPLSSVLFSCEEIKMTFPWYPLTLKDVLQDGSKLPVDEVKEIAHQLFRALAFVHTNDIVHRNIRPENIYLSGPTKFTLVLGDFSSASTVHSDSPCESRNRMQTLKERARLVYRSPESLLRLKRCGAATDVWAAGVVLAECLLGNVPWAGASSETELLMKIWSCVSGGPPGPEIELAFHFLVPCFNRTGSDDWMNQSTGAAASLLRRLFELNPDTRISATSVLTSSFVLGAHEDLVQSPIAPRLPIVDTAAPAQGQVPSDWVVWLLQISLVGLDAPSSLSVHKALRMVHDLPSVTPSLLLAAVKLSVRLETSRDSYKQAQCSELLALTGIDQIVESEVELLKLNALDNWLIPNTSVEFVRLHTTNNLSLSRLACYICDLALLESSLDKPMVVAVAAILVAAQWLQCEPPNLVIPIDDVQLALARCVSLVKSPREVTLWHKLPAVMPAVWQTSRSYLASLGRPQTPRQRLSTPHTPFFRTSTLQQATAWAQASRRRSRSAKRRRLSAMNDIAVTPKSIPDRATDRESTSSIQRNALSTKDNVSNKSPIRKNRKRDTYDKENICSQQCSQLNIGLEQNMCLQQNICSEQNIKVPSLRRSVRLRRN